MASSTFDKPVRTEHANRLRSDRRETETFSTESCAAQSEVTKKLLIPDEESTVGLALPTGTQRREAKKTRACWRINSFALIYFCAVRAKSCCSLVKSTWRVSVSRENAQQLVAANCFHVFCMVCVNVVICGENLLARLWCSAMSRLAM
jgi:hypothetical protein